MFRFLDGPAAGATLNLQRAPLFLRVVIDANGKIDALDQLTDEPTETEAIHVYRQVAGSVSSGIACSRDRGGGCRPFVSADYRVHETQPIDMQARDQRLWTEWCEGEAAALERPVSSR